MGCFFTRYITNVLHMNGKQFIRSAVHSVVLDTIKNIFLEMTKGVN